MSVVEACEFVMINRRAPESPRARASLGFSEDQTEAESRLLSAIYATVLARHSIEPAVVSYASLTNQLDRFLSVALEEGPEVDRYRPIESRTPPRVCFSPQELVDLV